MLSASKRNTCVLYVNSLILNINSAVTERGYEKRKSYTGPKWVSAGGFVESAFEGAFFEQEAAESAEVVEDSAAGSHVSGEFGEVEMNELQGFEAAGGTFGSGQRDVGFDLGQGFANGFCEERDVLVRTFDVIERSLGAMAHARPPDTLATCRCGHFIVT